MLRRLATPLLFVLGALAGSLLVPVLLEQFVLLTREPLAEATETPSGGSVRCAAGKDVWNYG